MQREFAAALTRKRFCKLVGIHRSTLKRWERAGIVEPKMESILGIPTALFSEDDVEFGRTVSRLLAKHHGELSVTEAAERARRTGRPR